MVALLLENQDEKLMELWQEFEAETSSDTSFAMPLDRMLPS
ncbi:HD domain-containing protein [Shewanella atlantica]|uniref:HD domain-containing protein n=1 Tax=Shewanella atlantica TaxID=271099 RepID=A0A3S0IGQ9_9GAMM|nr:HD domain-containing protein [Shewanella atlantica]